MVERPKSGEGTGGIIWVRLDVAGVELDRRLIGGLDIARERALPCGRCRRVCRTEVAAASIDGGPLEHGMSTAKCDHLADHSILDGHGGAIFRIEVPGIDRCILEMDRPVIERENGVVVHLTIPEIRDRFWMRQVQADDDPVVLRDIAKRQVRTRFDQQRPQEHSTSPDVAGVWNPGRTGRRKVPRLNEPGGRRRVYRCASLGKLRPDPEVAAPGIAGDILKRDLPRILEDHLKVAIEPRGVDPGASGRDQLHTPEAGVRDGDRAVAARPKRMLDAVGHPVVAIRNGGGTIVHDRERVLPVIRAHELDDRMCQDHGPVPKDHEAPGETNAGIGDVCDREKPPVCNDDISKILRLTDRDRRRDDPRLVRMDRSRHGCSEPSGERYREHEADETGAHAVTEHRTLPRTRSRATA